MTENITTTLPEGYIIQKAYEIDLDRLEEGYLSDSIVCYAENANKAKVELLKGVRYDDWKLRYSGNELTYLNIPVKRRSSADKVIFEGKPVLVMGTDNYDDYYPSRVIEWHPENLSINN